MWIVVPSGDLTVDRVLSLKRTGEVPVELHEGELRIPSPQPWWHSKMKTDLTEHFLRSGRQACFSVGVRLGDRSYRVPDVCVLRRDGVFDRDAPLQPADLVETVVEVVTPSSADEDLLLKPHVYARAGIPGYWTVEHRTVSMRRLRDGRYVLIGEVAVDELLAGGGDLV